jgi:hypothetical protein
MSAGGTKCSYIFQYLEDQEGNIYSDSSRNRIVCVVCDMQCFVIHTLLRARFTIPHFLNGRTAVRCRLEVDPMNMN